MKTLKQTARLFYGWWVMATAFLSGFMGIGIVYTFTLYFRPLIAEFNWSRTAISGAPAVLTIAGGLAFPFVGRLVDRIGAKRVMIPGSVLMGLALAVLSQIHSLWHLYFCYILMGIANAGLTNVTCAALVSNWFVKMRGRAMGIGLSGIGIGGFVLVPLVNYFINRFGWRMSYILLGIMVWIVLIPIMALVIKDKPEDMGLLPDGEASEEKKRVSMSSAMVGSSEPEGLVSTETLRTFRFWMLGLAQFLYGVVFLGIMIHLAPLLTDAGISQKNAVVAISCAVGLSALGKVVFSYLAEKFDTRYVLISSYLLAAIGILILCGVKSIGMLVAFVIVYGFAVGGGTPVMPLLAGKCFGVRSIGEIYGYLMLMFVVGNAVGPLLAGCVFDATQSYNWALIIMFMGLIVASIAISLVRIHKLQPG